MIWQQSRVLVTGAAGFIGTALTKRLVGLGANVVCLDNFSKGYRSNLSFFNGDLMESDVLDTDLSNKVQGKLDYIFHFGAPSSIILFNKDPVKCFTETCSGFLNIVKLAKEKGVEKIVYPSSGSVYGLTPPPQSEGNITSTLNLYGLAKLTCERIAEFYSKDVTSVGLRIFAGYGPNETHKGEIASPVSLFLKAIRRNERPIIYGDGNQSRDFIYIDSVIEAIINAAEKKTPPILNVGSGRPCTFNDLVKLINLSLGTKVEPVYIPKPSSYLEKTKADITLMEKTLGIKPIQLVEGLKLCVEAERQ